MRAAAVLVLLAATLAGCSDPGTSVDCAATVRYHGQIYENHGIYPRPRVPLAEPLGDGTIPRCGKDDPEVAMRLRRIRGVDPGVAVAEPRAGARPQVYVARGYLPDLAASSAHAAVWGHRSAHRPRHCTESFSYQHTVTPTDLLGDAEVHARTKVRAGRRHGEPFLAPGDRLRVTGHVCRDRRFADVIVAR